ncbi:MAG TPA: transglycosylase domain-containing protein, partial [Solirubrobacteraceae bacterium]|nr:transglycosylase domain-containing protein [Solirubrobacteraceae bacterium]
AILLPLGLLALVSTAFGMMMAVASDLPDLENAREYQNARNSVLVDARGRTLGVLTNNQSRILVSFDQIAPSMRNAVISIEDRRFSENSGVDLRGIARAMLQDVVKQRAAQGGSTITQQFVKNALRAQNDRTVFQKMREAALAYHLTRKWSKSKILTQYLNSIYFGNGAYGVEAAARTYFANEPGHEGCGTRERPCVSELKPWESALLAGLIASPSGYDPVAHPVAAKARRDLVLRRMYEQGRISRLDLFNGTRAALPAADEVQPPRIESKAPYFATWVRQQLVDRYGARRALEGGLKVRTTLDLDLQEAADAAVNQYLASPTQPSAALVAIDNDTGEVRAMVGGRDYLRQPFNLATQGQRQPGSSIKPFILAEALERGISPTSLWPSRKREFTVPGTNGREKFVVNNFEDSYAGVNTLARALTVSDNSVYAAVGIHVGTRRVARLARRMGIRTPVSTNYAMTLGGLRQGVTPLDMAHAYETFATGGLRVSGTLGSADAGPVGIRSVTTQGKDRVVAENEVHRRRVLRPDVAQTATSIMATVVQYGTGRRASLGTTTFAAGKTGTTENSADAWFVGFTKRLTVAIWVGYPQGFEPMKTEFAGGPVEGGTFPALIWHAFMSKAEEIYKARQDAERAKKGLPPLPETPQVPVAPPAAVPPEGSQATPTAPPSTGGGGTAPPAT